MWEDLLKSAQKCVVQTIINPGLFLMTEFKSSECYLDEMKEFEKELKNHLERLNSLTVKLLSVGQIVAVKTKTGFQRGLITDIYNKSYRNTFEVFLVDYGNVIEATEDDIALIKSDELRNKKLGAFEVALNGVQPATLDISHSSDGVFQKRVSSKWSTAAYRLVEEEMRMNPIVYVKYLKKDGKSASGDIYLLRKPEEQPVSLSEMLCHRGYAVKEQFSSDDCRDIERKIPKTALPRKVIKKEAQDK